METDKSIIVFLQEEHPSHQSILPQHTNPLSIIISVLYLSFHSSFITLFLDPSKGQLVGTTEIKEKPLISKYQINKLNESKKDTLRHPCLKQLVQS